MATYSPSKQEEQIQASIWRTRGWILQEEALSRRRLYFTDSRVSFECHEMRCLEQVATPLTLGGSTLDRRPLWNDLHRPEGIWGIVQKYSGRQLTNQDDKLIAITGVLNEWRRLHPDCFHFFGVPVIATLQSSHPSHPSIWDFLWTKFRFTRALLGGLYRWPKPGTVGQIAKRDPQFPSW